MSQNPLQQYFRQPKVFISLPSHGAYNRPEDIDGDVSHIPVYGMTGMDEILVKTPDALLTGDSTVKVITSCCPAIKNPWELTSIDLDLVLTAIRIATYGNNLSLTHICPHCSTENDYEFNLATFIDHYASCKYENKIIIGDLTVLLKPLTYKQSSEYALRNFQLQQQLVQVNALEDDLEKKKQLAELFTNLAGLQNDIFIAGIESVDTSAVVVTERGFIKEWVENCDTAQLDQVRQQIQKNQDIWRSPTQQVACSNCEQESWLTISLDQADFFVEA